MKAKIDCMTSFGMIDLNNLKPEDINMDKIRNVLLRTPRYNGHTPDGFSVLQHELFVHNLAKEDGVTDPRVLLHCLLHDSHEFLLGDMINPIARWIEYHIPEFPLLWNNLKNTVDQVIFQALSLSDLRTEATTKLVAKYDRRACDIEMYHYFQISPRILGYDLVEALNRMPTHGQASNTYDNIYRQLWLEYKRSVG